MRTIRKDGETGVYRTMTNLPYYCERLPYSDRFISLNLKNRCNKKHLNLHFSPSILLKYHFIFLAFKINKNYDFMVSAMNFHSIKIFKIFNLNEANRLKLIKIIII